MSSLPEFAPCKLNIYTSHSFIIIDNKRFIFNYNTKKLERNRVLQRDMKEETYLEYETKINEKLRSFESKEIKSESDFDTIFLFTESYGDRNICHWMTEQLMVLNYLINIMENYYYDHERTHITVILNKNRRESMRNIIMDYVKSVPELDHNNIIDYDFSGDMKVILCNTIYLGDALDCNLTNIYPLWDNLHSKLNIRIPLYHYRDIIDSSKNKIYVSRRNIYQPGKQTNTRILENFEEVSNKIVEYGYEEVFTDELTLLGSRIDLFKNADEIICELGAGMYNLLYCKEGVNIIVMYQKNNRIWLEEYYPLFKYKKMNVKIITGETTSPKHNGNWLNTPWKLNIDELDKILK